MPSYKFLCPACGEKIRKLLEAGEQKKPRSCPKCDTVMERDTDVPSQQVMETIDNGVMAHRVVRLKDAEELHRKRNKANG